MNQERYAVARGPTENSYEFFSEGSKGRIRKVVIFRKPRPGTVYNLSFGDWNDEIEWIDDRVISGNNDRRKILVTVANVVLEFMEANPGQMVFALGNTPARTRLYQMGIALSLEEITVFFDVFGCRQGHWEPFLRGVNYSSFFIREKKSQLNTNKRRPL